MCVVIISRIVALYYETSSVNCRTSFFYLLFSCTYTVIEVWVCILRTGNSERRQRSLFMYIKLLIPRSRLGTHAPFVSSNILHIEYVIEV